jgi:uncharacterized membrane protein
MKKSYIIVISVILVIAVVVPYLIIAASDGISTQVSDWALFSTYVNGLLMPLLTICNLVLLVEINKSVSSNVENGHKQLYKRLKDNLKNENPGSDFRVELKEQKTVSKSLDGLNACASDVYRVMNELADGNNGFEMVCLATPNVQTRLNLQIAQLKVNIYKELYAAKGDKSYEKQWRKAMKELEQLHKDSYLAD